VPLSAIPSVRGRASVSASCSEDCGVTLRAFAGRLPSTGLGQGVGRDLHLTHAGVGAALKG
jgi:hypothetical protein